MQDVFKRYAEIQQLSKSLEKEAQELKDHIIGFMNETDTQLVENEFGKFKIAERAVYKYSDAVKAEELKLKDLKKQEEENGSAQASTTRYLTFKE